MNDKELVLNHLKLTLESFLKLNAVVNFLDSGEFQSRVHDLLNVINLYKMTRCRQFDLFKLLLGQPVLASIQGYKGLLFLWSQTSSLIDEEAKLSNALLVTDLIKIHTCFLRLSSAIRSMSR